MLRGGRQYRQISRDVRLLGHHAVPWNSVVWMPIISSDHSLQVVTDRASGEVTVLSWG